MNDAVKLLEALRTKTEISDPVIEFARFLHHVVEHDQDIILTGAAVMRDHLDGHICSSFSAITDTLNEWGVPPDFFPDLEKSRSSEIISDGSVLTPLVIDNGNVYLHRFWRYECELAKWILNKASDNDPLPAGWEQILKMAFPDINESDERQIQAVERSHRKRIMVLTGGPGTGKTYTVKKILQTHLIADPELKIALAAPTGKAAQRVNESLAGSFDETVKATTIHSLLGSKGVSGRFRYGKDEPLPYDMILIDEASMMDLTMWIHLIRAVPEKARLVLLGDKNQLASVEAGSIFGDVCTAAHIASSDKPLAESVTELEKSYRFSEESGIYLLSKAILDGESDKAWNLLNDPEYEEVQVAAPTSDSMKQVLAQYIREPFGQMLRDGFTHSGFNKRQILCALRNGPFGVEEINEQGEKLAKQMLSVPVRDTWYNGRPVMIKRNDRRTGLRNGETGFAASDAENNGFNVFFESREEAVNYMRLPDHEPAHAVTIHKSQGSEYEDVAILLTNRENRLLSKELLYTAVTRARRSILVVSRYEQLDQCIRRNVSRNSDLIRRLTT